jgi:hypothetical protein
MLAVGTIFCFGTYSPNLSIVRINVLVNVCASPRPPTRQPSAVAST